MLKNMMATETLESTIQTHCSLLLLVLTLKCTRLRAIGSEVFYLLQNRSCESAAAPVLVGPVLRVRGQLNALAVLRCHGKRLSYSELCLL